MPADRQQTGPRDWLHAELLPSPGARFDDVLALALQAEAAGWTSLALMPGDASFDTLTLLAALAAQTRHIGLVAGIDPARTHPYDAARRLAALDHVSGGRAGWQLPAGLEPPLAAGYAHMLAALWDTWDDDARVCDKASGHYVNLARVRPAHASSLHWRSAGPLDIPRPPQGHPVRYGGPHENAEVTLLDSPSFAQVPPGPVLLRQDTPGNAQARQGRGRVFSLPIGSPHWQEILTVHTLPRHATTSLRDGLGLARPLPAMPTGTSLQQATP
ncbi:Nitrilotriacetate monooxygenase component A [plant metagenome]|uniref:Nitrilotriacetate monooxygenase component A n=1 Tax=plant metagenome TaxID=1297885 RepID=A0A484REY5_9ZZZZ